MATNVELDASLLLLKVYVHGLDLALQLGALGFYIGGHLATLLHHHR
jgi:hypothetical protein